MASVLAPINPLVLRWALDESGFTADDLALRIQRPAGDVEAWLVGDAKPTQSQLRKIGEQLRRPTALFYMKAPPTDGGVPANLRSAPGLAGHTLDHHEIRRIRWMVRLQRTLSWLARESGDSPVSLPRVDSGIGAEVAADEIRSWIGISVATQRQWRSGREAFEGWKAALEEKGLLVAQFQIDRQAIRGFSLWDEYVPVVAANTAYTPQARVFTLMHELGHMVRRDGSACFGFAGPADGRRGERWCEEFAAGVLLPRAETLRSATLARLDQQEPYDLARSLAKEFSVSVRAAALRLIELDLADRSLYDLVDAAAGPRFDDFPEKRGGGGGGETAPEARVRQLGAKAVDRLLTAEKSGALTRRDVGDYLHLGSTQVSQLADLTSR